jgi:ATP-dependent RNA helicase DDX31/DBP7
MPKPEVPRPERPNGTKLGAEAPRAKRIEKAGKKPFAKGPIKPLAEILGLREVIENEVSTVFTDRNFSDLPDLNDYLKKQLVKSSYTKMTKIQTLSFNSISEGKDIVLKAQTGSGKTLAYVAPLLNKLMSAEPRITRNDGIKILILCPIRELCLQILNTLQSVGRACVNLVPGVLIGGEDIKAEKERIRKGLSIVIGTPGRILYHLQNTQNFSLSGLTSIVFEECDRVLDMGFSKEITTLLTSPKLDLTNVQRIMVSASITDQVQDLLQMIARSNSENLEESYEFIGFEGDKRSLHAPSKLKHFYVFTEESRKLANFFTILKLIEQEKAIVFVSTADQANFLETLCCGLYKPTYRHHDFESKNRQNDWNQQSHAPAFDHRMLQQFDQDTLAQDIDAKFLAQANYSRQMPPQQEEKRENFLNMLVLKIHGHMMQKERSAVFDEFRKSKSGILICTDVGSRGLDYTDTKIIILFDVSPSYKDYINRVGRTARIDKEGAAISLLYPQENIYAEKLAKNAQAQELSILHIEDIFASESQISAKNLTQFIQYEINGCISRKNLRYLSRRAFNSFCRAYTQLKDEVSFSIKKLNLTGISKSYGLKSSLSKNADTHDEGYKVAKDSKNLSSHEVAFLERKRMSTIEGIKKVKDRNYMNSEFM